MPRLQARQISSTFSQEDKQICRPKPFNEPSINFKNMWQSWRCCWRRGAALTTVQLSPSLGRFSERHPDDIPVSSLNATENSKCPPQNELSCLAEYPMGVIEVSEALPWTVVVHSTYTMATTTAVVGPFRSHHVALATHFPLLSLWNKVTKKVSMSWLTMSNDILLSYKKPYISGSSICIHDTEGEAVECQITWVRDVGFGWESARVGCRSSKKCCHTEGWC